MRQTELKTVIILLLVLCCMTINASEVGNSSITKYSFKDPLDEIEKGNINDIQSITRNLINNMRTMGFSGIYTLIGGSAFGTLSLGLLYGSIAGYYNTIVIMVSMILGSIGGLLFVTGLVLAAVGFGFIARNMRGPQKRKRRTFNDNRQLPEMAVSFQIGRFNARDKSGESL